MSVLEQLKRHEGLRLEPYRCTEGFLTIGYGRNLDAKGISQLEAIDLLIADIEESKTALNDRGLLDGLDEARAGVLINMAFQLGINGLLKFKNTLRLVKEGRFEEASVEMLDSLWAKQTPSRAEELSQQMKTGVFAE